MKPGRWVFLGISMSLVVPFPGQGEPPPAEGSKVGSRLDPGTDGSPPGDAVVLFDGRDLSRFTQLDGSPASWKVEGGAMTAGDEDIVTRDRFSDAQVHVEFNLPEDREAHGNSGLYFHHLYELQILDSFSGNDFAPDQQCGSLPKVSAPLVNVTRPPGEWQSFDIVFHAARLDPTGRVTEPARFTVFHNGVLIQYERRLFQGTGAGKRNPMVSKGPLKLQAHRSPVRFRNLWYRPLRRVP